MLAIPHMLAGTAVVHKIQQPSLALPFALVSHLLLDVIPHLDSHAVFGVNSGGPTPAEVTMAILDFLTGIAIVIWATSYQPRRKLLLMGAFLGIAIDLFDNVPLWNGWFHELPGMAAFSAFHHGIQHNVHLDQWVLGFGTQIILVVISLALLIPARTGNRS